MKYIIKILIVIQLLIPTHLLALECDPGEEVRYNRCVSTQETLNQQARGNKCATAEDPQQCYYEMAQKDESKQRADARNGDYDTSNFGIVGQAAIHTAMILVSGYVLDFWLSKGSGRMGCKPPSMYLMTAAASALLVTEIMSYMTYSKKMKERNEAVRSFVEPDKESEDYSENAAMKDYTVLAYDSIILKEKAYLAANKTRRTGYAIATGAFGAATAVAASELYLLKRAKVQYDASTTTEDKTKWKGKLDQRKRDLICGKTSRDSVTATKRRSSRNADKASRGGGGMLTSMIPMLIMPAVGGLFSNIDKELPETYVGLDNMFNGTNFLNLPSSVQAKLVNIKNINSMADLNTIVREKEMLEAGYNSSPSLADYEVEAAEFHFIDTESLEQTKSALMIQETFREQFELIEILGNDNSTAKL